MRKNIQLHSPPRKPQEWEVWWAYTLFYDTSNVKMRPVIILKTSRDMIPAIELTSHAPRDWLVMAVPASGLGGYGSEAAVHRRAGRDCNRA